MSEGPQAKANGRTRKKRFFHLAPEPKDKRARPENPLSGSTRPTKDECMLQCDFLQRCLLDQPDLSLQELWQAMQVMGEHLSSSSLLKILERLPRLLASSALSGLDLAMHLDKGQAVEAGPLPTSTSEDVLVNEAFLVLHGRIEAILDGAMQSLLPAPPLQWLSAVAMFYGHLRPAPLPRHVLEDCADLALKADAQDLRHLSRIACGAALSGSLGRHGIYRHVADSAAEALEAKAQLPSATLHDIALALSLLQPWDSEIDIAVRRFRDALVVPSRTVQGTEEPFIGACSMAGQRNGEAKENQDTFYSSVEESVAYVAVVDGHGRKGGVLSAAARDAIATFTQKLESGSSHELAEVMLLVDAELLIHEKAEPELSGATCVVMRIQGIGQPKRRLSLVHLGDCGAVLGRCKAKKNGSTGQFKWSTRHLTKDHRPGEDKEAARLVAAGGRVQKLPPIAKMDPANMGPPRLWHRQRGQAPGLAMSRGLGDTLGKACGLSAHAAMLEMDLTEEDVVVVLGSDGIFDVLSDAEVLHCCRQHIESRDAMQAAEAVTQCARRNWLQRGPYVDDCTCVVVFL